MPSISRPGFFLSTTAVAVLAALAGCANQATTAAKTPTPTTVVSVEFTNTPAPSATDPDKMARTYTSSVAKVTYGDGSVKTYPLAFNTLFSVQDKINEVKGVKHPAGQLFDAKMQPLKDPMGQPLVAETPDANSLLAVGDKLFMVTHYEYDWVLADKTVASKAKGWYARSPMGMTLTELKQAKDGTLNVIKQSPIDFSGVEGLWIPCAGSQTPWNTHLGSEEDYDLQFSPLTKNAGKLQASLKAMSAQYLGGKPANPYHYGYIPEVDVRTAGKTLVSKHYAMGRGTWELARLAPDGKTAYLGDDGTYGLMLMYVGDAWGNLDSGSLYAAKWNQTSDQGGGKANLNWVKLGHATSDEVKKLANTHSFTDIFDAAKPEGNACPASYTRIRAGSKEDECLKVKPGKEKAAAFLETRRMATLMGATTEFTKYEGVAINAADKKLYLAMSAVRDSMTSAKGEPADHIRLPANEAGATYTADLASGQRDQHGSVIASDFVATKIYVEPALLGLPLATPDAKGNTADDNHIAQPDNLFYSEKMRTLFVGEDSLIHTNNYLWAYNLDTKKLTRILSAAAGAENTGLQVLDDLHGHAYIMANNQHWGDFAKTVPAELAKQLKDRIDVFHAPVGYLGGLPAIK
ncbi:MAG: DUF839 domain-containing protein [Rhodoferax sp.]|uniref:PhoX family protein n=1 Tax=Rhodoferax sp. TaxID=50421 RepID=UPI002734DEEC|nr:alkaline phosphatase PhoX [Rhodoferax sp.]MDP2678939.1 DUF839 domain-containing protein [Rhodoferax sp.]